MAEQGAVIEGYFGVEGDNLTRAGHDQRVDLHNRAVKFNKGAVKGQYKLGEGCNLLARQPKAEGELARMKT